MCLRDVTGRTAHQVLGPLVNAPTWSLLPEMAKRRVYEIAFERAR